MEKRTIAVISGKGGVGKTTMAVNTATQLSLQGASVLLMDADFYNPCVFFHLGLPSPQAGLRAVLHGKARVEDALTIHKESGLRCISASMKFHPDIKSRNLKKIVNSLNYDCILIDCAPGFSKAVADAAIAADELFVLITPDIPSVTAAMRLVSALIKRTNFRKVCFVLNRVRNSRNELHVREIKNILCDGTKHKCTCEMDIIVPEDGNIPDSLSVKTPVVLYQPSSPSSKAFKKFIKKEFPELNGKAELVPELISKPLSKEGFVTKILNFVMGLFGG